MSYIADLHIHSKYAGACSKDLNLENIATYAKLKGVQLIATGDCLHPLWLQELKNKLSGGETGLFKYNGVRFLLTCEVSLIFFEDQKKRQIHLNIFFPNFNSVEKLQKQLLQKNIDLTSDGRPAINLSLTNFCEIVFSIDKKIFLIPAHIWTPWYGLFGSKFGFDFFIQAFKSFSSQISAIETGISSTPDMNWRIAELDGKAVLSFSDAHSLKNIGREATYFRGGFSYDELVDDIKNQNIEKTIEYFPQMSQYFLSGHRNCKYFLEPGEIDAKGEDCPVCKNALTIGSLDRVEKLATRPKSDVPSRPPFQQIIQLEEIIAQALEVSKVSQKVEKLYQALVQNLDSEINILTVTSLKSIESLAGEKVAKGIQNVRVNNLEFEGGFDNSYGQVKIFKSDIKKQITLF